MQSKKSELPERPSRKILDEFLEIDTSNIADALIQHRIRNSCPQRLYPLIPGKKVAGPAYTVQCLPYYEPPKGEKFEYYWGPSQYYGDLTQRGDVVCVAGGVGIGNMIATAAVARGVAGHVVDGNCRDTAYIRKLEYPAWIPYGSISPAAPTENMYYYLQRPMGLRGTFIKPNDIIVADDDGVVVVPLETAESVLEVAKEVQETETKEAEEIMKTGLPGKVFLKYGHMYLKRPRPDLEDPRFRRL